MAKHTVLGVLPSENEAEKLLVTLEGAGFCCHDDVSVVVANHARPAALDADGGAPASVIGGAAGLLAGVGAIAVPSFGVLIVAGPVLETLSGAALGASAGSLERAFVAMGIDPSSAGALEHALLDGKAVVAVHATEQAHVETLRKLLTKHGAEGVCIAQDSWASIDDMPTVPYGESDLSLR